MNEWKDELERACAEHVETLRRMVADGADRLDSMTRRCVRALGDGGKLLVFGNGGSASLAQEIAAELVHRYEQTRDGLAAVALVSDAAVVTSIANDTRFERVFARQIEALGRPGDVALGISTSGGSPSVVEALRTARQRGLVSLALLGRDGGAALDHVDEALVVSGKLTSRIQEAQLFAAHVLCARIERSLTNSPGSLSSGRRRARSARP